jgi:hypothetical protein
MLKYFVLWSVDYIQCVMKQTGMTPHVGFVVAYPLLHTNHASRVSVPIKQAFHGSSELYITEQSNVTTVESIGSVKGGSLRGIGV